VTIVATAGKGGVGKSTLAALLVRAARDRGIGPVLAIDADPNPTLPDLLGISPTTTVAAAIPRGDAPAGGGDKRAALEAALHDAVAEGEGFDLLVMGRPEGPGCYCYVNHLIREFVSGLRGAYPLTVIDNEAGMEHLSRHTDGRIDHLLLVSGPGRRDLETARRILELAGQLGLARGGKSLAVSRLPEGGTLPRVDWIGTVTGVPADPRLAEGEAAARSVFLLPPESPALVGASSLLSRIVS
jgi:CO dehydrogenase maturation factor